MYYFPKTRLTYKSYRTQVLKLTNSPQLQQTKTHQTNLLHLLTRSPKLIGKYCPQLHSMYRLREQRKIRTLHQKTVSYYTTVSQWFQTLITYTLNSFRKLITRSLPYTQDETRPTNFYALNITSVACCLTQSALSITAIPTNRQMY